MRNCFTRSGLCVLFFLSAYVASAQNNYWTVVSGSRPADSDVKEISQKKSTTLTLDTTGLKNLLALSPKEFTAASKSNPAVLIIPMPDGNFKNFKIVETSMMEPGLAKEFPNIKTYSGQGIEDPYATIKIDWNELGFHAMILSPINGTVLIDPSTPESKTSYLSFKKSDIAPKSPFTEGEFGINKAELAQIKTAARGVAASCIAGTLRSYRLAVACTGEYARAVGGTSVTVAQALSAIVTSVNRVNGVYETEVDIRLVLVGNNKDIVFINPDTDSFAGNSSGNILIDESQKVITEVIGTANFDIGHTFSTGGGGLAITSSVCNAGTKASGITGLPNPVGDAYNIDYVAHEIGHQFGGNHTFNATTGECGRDNGNSFANAEPGSGSTIMAYANLCNSTNNLQARSDPYFHAISFDEITNYAINGFGNTCGVPIQTGNTAPVVNAGRDYIIPKSTPFVLTGAGSDVNGDVLTYSWEQVNVGGPAGNWNAPVGDAPIFRSFLPVPNSTRYFPRLTNILNNSVTIGEILPTYARNLNFRLTARDNRAGGGGVCSDETVIGVSDNSGPFIVTAPNTATSWDASSFQTITWDVANTTAAPVSCVNVSIELSTDGGLTFPITILASTPNDGSEEIIVPNNPTSTARIRVKAVDNVFFDISNANITINAVQEVTFIFNSPKTVFSCTGNTRGTILNTSSVNNYTTPVTLSATGNPAGSTVVFSGNPITPGSSDSITLSGNIAPGTYNITITGTSGSITKTRVIKFVIGAPASEPVKKSPANSSIGNTLNPTFSWQVLESAQTYRLEISTSKSFSNIIQTIDNIADTSYTISTPLAENTEYYWRVFALNTCGTGPVVSSNLFKTWGSICGNAVYSTNGPIIIPPDDVATITSTINIPTGGVISDVDVVGLNGTHTYVSDLTVSLMSPASTEIVLFGELCGNSHDFNLNFDDQATLSTIPCPLTGGSTVRPQQALSNFNNQNSQGTWTLKVYDAWETDGGSLNGWGLRICTYAATALPVNWLTFTGRKLDNNSVQLNWSTANETNNHHYEIERSANGIEFSSIGEIAAGNTPGSAQQYIINDGKPFAGANYYRLKQVDKDGHFTYSEIVKVVVAYAGAKYVIYPNPAVDNSTVRILTDMKQLTLRMHDALGKVVYQRVVGTAKANTEYSIPVKELSKGLYIVTLTTDAGSSSQKIIVQ
ncbi:MAG TPA: zinc-dependent metalloprotease family protein [Segetibacter sp.]